MRLWFVAMIIGGFSLSAPALASDAIEIAVESSSVVATVGATEFLSLIVTNSGTLTTGPLVAHLVVVNPDSSASADAEDWTSELTRRIDALEAGESVAVEWDVKPIASGRFIVLVTVVSDEPTHLGSSVSAPVVFEVAQPPRVFDGAVLPVSVVTPLVLLGLALGTRRREARRIEQFVNQPR